MHCSSDFPAAGMHRCGYRSGSGAPGPLRRWAMRCRQRRLTRFATGIGLDRGQQTQLEELLQRWQELRIALADTHNGLAQSLPDAIAQTPFPRETFVGNARAHWQGIEQSIETLAEELAAFGDGLDPGQRQQLTQRLRR